MTQAQPEPRPRIRKVILLIETSRAFGRGLLYGIARYCRTHGPWSVYREPGGLEHSFSALTDWNADGIIARNPKKMKELASLGIPCVLVIHHPEAPSHFPRVVTNGSAVARMAAQHFLDRGFRNFAFCGFEDIGWSRQRCREFQRCLRPHGCHLHIYQQSSERVERSWKTEQAVLARWLKQLPKPVAVLACNDDRALHASEAAKLAGIDVPEQLAILGVDNDEIICELADPPLSSIAMNTEHAGYQAAQLLEEIMNGQPMQGQKLFVEPTYIVTRQSTDILAIDDPELADAIRFIRESALRNIAVNDVAAAAGLSRRVLERRFRNVLHRSAVEEIRRVRIARITALLAETDLTIAQIADRLEFTDRQHIARYFRTETGMSLQAYRKRFGQRYASRS